MIKDNLAIIPARSGSKGLKNKNIKLLNGEPLISYTIRAAQESDMFGTIMVSTDSEEYAEIAKKYGAEVPFLRSEKTSSDAASSWDVVAEVIDNYAKKGKRYETFMLLQPTSPLRRSIDICGAYKELFEKNAQAIVSVCEMEHSPLQSNTLPDDLSLAEFDSKEAKGKRRQDIDTYYRVNGAIYLSSVRFFKSNHDIIREGCYAYIMNRMFSIDIDDNYDFLIAESIMKEMDKKGKEE